MEKVSEKTKWQSVMYDVFHFTTARNFLDEVFVMPERIRSVALLVDEKLLVFYMRNFGNPFEFDTEQRRNSVLNDLPGEHFPIVARKRLKTHAWRCNDG